MKLKSLSKFNLIYITFPSKKEAQKIGEILIKERLAACVNIFKIESLFWWEEKIERQNEIGMFVKTKSKLIEKIIKRVKELHSYKVPCIIAIPIEKGFKEFLEWIKEATQKVNF